MSFLFVRLVTSAVQSMPFIITAKKTRVIPENAIFFAKIPTDLHENSVFKLVISYIKSNTEKTVFLLF